MPDYDFSHKNNMLSVSDVTTSNLASATIYALGPAATTAVLTCPADATANAEAVPGLVCTGLWHVGGAVECIVCV